MPLAAAATRYNPSQPYRGISLKASPQSATTCRDSSGCATLGWNIWRLLLIVVRCPRVSPGPTCCVHSRHVFYRLGPTRRSVRPHAVTGIGLSRQAGRSLVLQLETPSPIRRPELSSPKLALELQCACSAAPDVINAAQLFAFMRDSRGEAR